MFSTLLVAFSVFTLGLGTPVPSSPIVERGTDIVPFAPVGNVVAVQNTAGSARLFYQKSDGSIWQQIAIGSFDTGTNDGSVQIVSGDEVLRGTPLAVAMLGVDSYEEMHVVYFSPNNVLSEAIWAPGQGGFLSGAECPQCITNQDIVAEAGSKVLYVMQNQDTSTLSVGFVSAGAPGTISELDNDTGAWNAAALPN